MKTKPGIRIALDDNIARGRVVPPGDGQMSRGIESIIAQEPGNLAHVNDFPPASSQRVARQTKATLYADGGPNPLNGSRAQMSPAMGLEGKQPVIDSPMPTTGRQMPHPDLASKAQEAASADASIGDVPHPSGTLGRG